MEELKEIAKWSWKELMAARHYASEAIKHKENFPELASVYHRIGGEEVIHAEMLCGQANALINKWHRDHHPDAEKLRIIWSWDHERLTEEMASVKHLMEMYK